MDVTKLNPTQSLAQGTSNTSQSKVQNSTQTQTLNQDSTQNPQDLSKKLNNIVDNLNKHMNSLDANVRFGYSDKLGALYISVTEKNTGREIRQIPSEEAMRLAEYFKDAIGMIFDKES